MRTITIQLDEGTFANICTLVGPDDAKIASFIGDYLATHLSSHAELTSEQRAAIEEGLAAIERGDVVPHEEVFAKLESRYRE